MLGILKSFWVKLGQIIRGSIEGQSKKDKDDDLQKRVNELAILNKLSIALSSGQDLYHLLRLLLEELKKVFVIDDFYIGIYDPETETVHFPIFYDRGEFLGINSRNLREEPGFTGAVIFSEKTLYIPDQTDPEVVQRYKPFSARQRQSRSYIGTPLMLNNKVIGVLSVQSEQPNVYTPQQIQLLETIAAQSAIAIDKARLFDELQSELAERERSEQALRESESKLRAIIENVPFDMWISDKDNRYVLQSGESYRMAGDIIGKIPEELGKPPEIVTQWKEEYQRAMNGETVYKEVAWEVDGKMTDFMTTLAPVKDKEAIIGYVGINLDITERKRSEQALRESESKLRAIIENIPFEIWLSDKERRYILQSGESVRLAGNIIGKTIEDLGMSPEITAQWKAEDERVMEGKTVYKEAKREVDGELRDFITYLAPVRDGGETFGFVGISLDITERKQAEGIILQREAILEAIAFAAEQFFKTANWRININIILERLGKVIDCTHVYIFENFLAPGNKPASRMTYEWTASGYQPELIEEKYQSLFLQEDGFEYWYKMLSIGEPFVSSSPILPDNEKEHLTARGIKALVDVPIYVNNKWWGIIGFDDMVKEREWSAAELDTLKVASNVFGAAIQRQQIEEEIHQINLELEQRVEQRTTQLQEINQSLNQEKFRLEQYTRQREIMAAMTDLLQASLTMEEASSIVSTHFKLLFPNRDGALHLTTSSNTFEPIAVWGEKKSLDIIYTANECWALRRGKPYHFGVGSPNPPCAHVGKDIPQHALCIPLAAQGESLGNLHISTQNNQALELITDEDQKFIETIADSIALAIANIRLREKLHNQAIRDPLTGLFNRRFMEETLDLEVHRATRANHPLSVIMLEIDNFRIYNNTFGHEVGNYVLKKLSDTIRAILSRSDFPCRYGGDEFTIILPETTLKDAAQKAEDLRKSVQSMVLSYNNQALGTITLSLGVASFPQHGETGEAVLKMADAASYKAKDSGKNCVVVSES